MKRLLPILFLTLPLWGQEYLTLSNAWEMAMADNPTLEAARQRMFQAEARWKQTQGGYHPTIRAEASGQQVGYSSSQQMQNPRGDDSQEQYAARVEGQWLLFDGGTRKNSVRAARSTLDGSESSVEETRQTLLQAVAQTYFRAQLAVAAIEIAEEDAIFNSRQLSDSERRLEAGQGSFADTLNFQIRLNSASSSVFTAENDLVASKAALNALLGLSGAIVLPDPAPLPPNPEFETAPTLRSAWERAKMKRPDLSVGSNTVDAAEATFRSVRGEYIPDISLFGNVGADRIDDPDFTSDDVGETVGVAVSVDLWTGHVRKQRLRETRAQLNEAKELYRNIELDAQAELRQALSSYETAIQQYEIAFLTRKLAAQNRDLIEKAYRAGTESLIRLNEAQRDSRNADSRAVLSQIEVELNWIDLLTAMGELTGSL